MYNPEQIILHIPDMQLVRVIDPFTNTVKQRDGKILKLKGKPYFKDTTHFLDENGDIFEGRGLDLATLNIEVIKTKVYNTLGEAFKEGYAVKQYDVWGHALKVSKESIGYWERMIGKSVMDIEQLKENVKLAKKHREKIQDQYQAYTEEEYRKRVRAK
jgi:hypothetical protein